jgi:hypothetical protein
VFGVGFVRDPCSVKRWLNLASTPSRRVVGEREGLYVFVEYDQGSWMVRGLFCKIGGGEADKVKGSSLQFSSLDRDCWAHNLTET